MIGFSRDVLLGAVKLAVDTADESSKSAELYESQLNDYDVFLRHNFPAGYTPTDEEIDTKFEELLDKWKAADTYADDMGKVLQKLTVGL